MAKKKKEVKAAEKEMNKKGELEKVQQNAFGTTLLKKKRRFHPVFIGAVSLFIFTWSIMGYGFYYIISSVVTPVELPQIDMNQYWGTYPMNPVQDLSIRPFKIEFSDVMIHDLRERLLHQRPFQPPLEESGFTYGVNSNFLVRVLDFWKNKYDFKGRERFFNKYDHFVVNIQGLDIHYVHVLPPLSSKVKVLTLLLLHSWPGGIREFYEVIPKLIEPNDKYNFVFEVIVPSLPGFGFSQAPVRAGMDPANMAIVVSKLMQRIGRSTYYVHGGDIGHSVGSALATIFPDNVLGFHTSTPKICHPLLIMKTVIALLWPAFVAEPEIPKQPDNMNSFLRDLFDQTGYLHMQATKPDTIGIALTDSPAGLAAYIMEKYSLLNNPLYKNAEDGQIRTKFSLTQLLDTVMLHWAPGTISSSMRVHAEHYHWDYFNYDRVETEVPTWGLKAKHYLAISPPSVLKKKYKNYLHTTVMDDGGYFVAMEYPDILANDIFAAVDTFIAFHAQHGKSDHGTQSDFKPKINTEPKTVYEFSVTDINGKEVQLEKYKGFVLLIVNVASECGLTDRNYDQLVKLYDQHEGKGLRILAFPCNQFGSQEPGSPDDIKQFTNARGVRFDVFSKIDVNGDNTNPLWNFLKRTQGGTLGDWIKWNFSKFIVDKDGIPVERFGPDVDPMDLESVIVKYLNVSGEDNHNEF